MPKTIAHGPGFLLLDVDAIGTFDRWIPRLAKGSVPYAEGIAVTEALGEALAAAHAVGETLGGMAMTNGVITREGRIAIVGFGGHAAASSDSNFWHPTVAAGGPPSAPTDVYAAIMFIRSLAPYVAGMPAPLADVLSGRSMGTFSGALFDALTLSGKLDGGRAMRTLRAFWRRIGVTPDEEGLARRLLDANLGRAAARLVVGAGGAWFAIDDGPRVDLAAKRALRAILVSLVDAHRRSERLTVPDLVAAGWPGESMRGTSGPDRLYTALASLRAAGLRDVFERTHDGYGINAEVEVVAL